MKITLYKYIIKEIIPTFLACLFVSAFIVLATKMILIMDLVVTKGVPVSQVLWMIIYLLPDIMLFALPAATLISVVLAFLRFSSDSEIIALKASGISLYQMMPPVVLFSVSGLVFGLFISLLVVPWGNISFKTLRYQFAGTNANLVIKERVFCEPIKGIVFYVNHYQEEDKSLEKIFISDRRDQGPHNTIVAEKGRIFFHPTDNMIMFRLTNGIIYVAGNKPELCRSISFKTYDLSLDLNEMVNNLGLMDKDPKEMTQSELLQKLKSVPKEKPLHNEMIMEFMERYSIPLAVFLMGVIGMPLGARLKSRGRSAGIGVSLAVFVIYYLFLAGVRSVGESGFLPPEIGVWVPVLFLVVCGAWLFHQIANEKSINIFAGWRSG